MKLLSLTVSSFIYLFVALSANAATFIVNNVQTGTAASDTIYANSDGSLSSGGIVTIGYFASGFDVNANLSNYAALRSNFTTVTSELTGSNSPSLAGSFAGFVEQSNPTEVGHITTGNTLLGRGVYSFIGNLSTLAASTQLGLIFIQNIANDVPFNNAYSSSPHGLSPLIGTTGSYVGNAGGLVSYKFLFVG